MATGVSDHDLMFSKKAEDSALQQSGGQWPQPVDSRQAARPPPPLCCQATHGQRFRQALLTLCQVTRIFTNGYTQFYSGAAR